MRNKQETEKQKNEIKMEEGDDAEKGSMAIRKKESSSYSPL